MFNQNQLMIFANCKRQSIEKALEKPAEREYSEVSFSQNIFEVMGMFVPNEFNVKQILQSPRAQEIFKGVSDFKELSLSI